MALLQRTFASGSLWIGTGSAYDKYLQYLNNQGAIYPQIQDRPFAIYNGGNPLLYFNSHNSTNTLTIPSTSSIGSPTFVSGFGPSAEGFKISAIPKTIDTVTNLFWTGQFDDLYVRGSMHVKEFVIDQIRATNGSLWITDAAKASSASWAKSIDSNSGTMSLYFDTGSTMPFIKHDIIRSKRWIPGGGGIQHQWDFVGGVSSVKYDIVSNGTTWSVVEITGSRTGEEGDYIYNNYYLDGNDFGNWKRFVDTISVLQSQWVRVGNLNNTHGRTASIYLTSNDSGGPFMDMASGVNSIANALGGTPIGAGAGSTISVSSSNLRLRIGNLEGITDTQNFGGSLTGYGLYADNAYLKGKIIANEGGTISNWTLGPNELKSGDVRLHSETNNNYYYFGVGANAYGKVGIWIGQDGVGGNNYKMSLGGDEEEYIRYDGSNLTISTPNFTVQNGNVSMSGTISATEGDIGGWKIAEQKLYSGKVTMSSTANDTYLGFNAGTWGIPNSIYIGSGSQGPRFAVSGSSGYMWFSNSTIAISTSNFSAIGRNVTMSGNIKAKSGNIANWIISGYNLYSGNVTLSSISGNQYMGIGAASYSSSGIYLGSKSGLGNRFSITNNISGLFWDGSNLGITTSNFTLSQGKITAQQAEISGKITSGEGEIGGWKITQNDIHKTGSTEGRTIISSDGKYINVVNDYGLFNKTGYSQLRTTNSKYSALTGSSGVTAGFKTASNFNQFTYTASNGHVSSKDHLTAQFNGSDGWKLALFLSYTNSVMVDGAITNSIGDQIEGEN